MPRPLQKPVNRYFSKNSGEIPQRCQRKKVALHERRSGEPKKSRKILGGTELRPERTFVTWVPNQQNWSPIDEMTPSAPQNGHILGPKGTWDPTQGSLGPHLGCDQIWSAGISPRTAPKTRKIRYLDFWPILGPGRPQKFSKSPGPPKTSKSQIAGKIPKHYPTLSR